MPDPEEKTTAVFVSYSHRDQKWLERLQVHLKPLVREGDIDLWDDTRIQPGADWKAEIDHALAAAQVAVLLVSPDFLASDFIHDEELPVLLEAAERRGTRILPVILSHCLYADSRLGRFQAINAPDKPLEGLPKAGRDKALSDLARAIAAGLSADAPASASTEPKPTPSQKGARGARKAAPSPPPENRPAEHPSRATWVLGGLLVVFLFVGALVWWLSPLVPIGPAETDNRETTGTGSASVGNGAASTGSQTIEDPVTITSDGSSPPKEMPAEPGSASAHTGIANTGEQTIKGPVIITGGSSSPPGEAPAEPGSASAGTGIANTGNQTIEGPVTIGGTPGEEKR